MSVNKKDNTWLSFSDLMTGLMVIFMFIAIAFMLELQQKQAERDKLFEEFKASKEELYAELDSVFNDDFENWNVKLDRDLSIKFTNPEVLFASGSAIIRPEFKTILNSFLPRYFNILLQEKYRDRIAEVRIEGHTDDLSNGRRDPDPYIDNIRLSQLRSARVLKHFRSMVYYGYLVPVDKDLLQFWTTANGLSYGRTVDENGDLTVESGLPLDRSLSRRVEFRIITSTGKLVEDVLEEIGN